MKIKLVIAALAAVLISTASYAVHSWGDYHWARTSSSFNLPIVNSTTSDWQVYVTQAISDWSDWSDWSEWTDPSMLNMIEERGDISSRTRRKCKAPGGKVRICNLAYGNNGWLGLAGISIDSEGHIVSGYTKLNDTYFATGFYNNDAWRQSVTCQELGHNIGLGHQDVDFNNDSLDSCMDYQIDPFKDPNEHDYEQLGTIYGHIDGYDSYAGGGDGVVVGDDGCNAPPGRGCNKGEVPGRNGDIGWGMSIGRRGQTESFMRIDPDGTRHVTYVTWVIGH